MTFIITTVRSLVNSYFYIFIPISQINEAGHLYRQTLDFRPLPYGQFLKSLRWGLPQSPVIASRAVITSAAITIAVSFFLIFIIAVISFSSIL